MILYPTETIYALGVNALDDESLGRLFLLKGRDERQTVSWIVRDIEDIAHYAELSELAEKLIKEFLPGPLTIVLPAKNTVPASRQAPDNTVGFRISPDPIAQSLIADFMAKHDAPLTCTSANISGLPTAPTVPEILEQLRHRHRTNTPIDWSIYDDGPRVGAPSTVVKVMADDVTIIREGAIAGSDIMNSLK